MRIRRATKEDFESLKKIKILSKKEELKYSETIKDVEGNKKNYYKYLKRDLKYISRGVFIAVEKKKIIGMVLAQYFKPLPISKYNKKGYISNLFIDKEYRRKGIAKKLILKSLEWLKKNKVPYISVEIHIDNLAPQNLCKGLGFENYTLKMVKKI